MLAFGRRPAVRDVAVVVLSRYADLFEGFKKSIEQHEKQVMKVLVRDGREIKMKPHHGHKWAIIAGIEPFIFARNMNIGWRSIPNYDVVVCGDDVRFVEPFIKKLREVAYSDPKIGFAVPELGGQSCFVCAYIKRDLINQVGEMDEQFDGYGMDDIDYYTRFEALGWRTQPTTEVKVLHTGGTSFYRKEREGLMRVQERGEEMRRRFEAKWGTK